MNRRQYLQLCIIVQLYQTWDLFCQERESYVMRRIGANVLLVDRDVDVTPQRLATRSSLGSIDNDRAKASQRNLGAWAPDQSITGMSKILNEEIPRYMQHSFVHITGEGRVLFMAEVLRTYPCRNVVGVMVLAHQPGIEESLEAAGLHTFLQLFVMMQKWVFLLGSVLCFTLLVLNCYSNVKPYMAQHYCRNEFDVWNKGITTFPGLYLVAYLASKTFSVVACSTFFLRTVNLLISCSLPIIFYMCRKEISPVSRDNWVIAAILYLYPLNMFYYFLFYTDTLSTTTLVLTYWLSMRGSAVDARKVDDPTRAQRTSSRSWIEQATLLLAASASVLARQTNAVWLMFIVGTDMLGCLTAAGELQDQELTLTQCWVFVCALWKRKWGLFQRIWPLLLPVAAFAAFVLYTGSIVLGDKENHQPVLHGAMLSHALLLVALVTAPIEAWERLSARRNRVVTATAEGSNSGASNWKAWVGYTLLGAGVACALVLMSYSHPFLLSDNRHYMFYIRKRILTHDHWRLLLSPVYALAACVAVQRLRRRRGPLWVLIFFIALVITLVPTPLLEPRYFTPGVVIAVLNSPPLDVKSTGARLAVGAVVVAMLLVNAVTIAVFVTRPFVWGDGSIARFMY